MKYLAMSMVITAALAFTAEHGYAWKDGKPVTPYGDYCPKCSKYGKCESMMSSYEAKKAMQDYYRKKGYDVEIDDMDGRFIKAKIRRKKDLVDVIIFDRRTGRIRSIY